MAEKKVNKVMMKRRKEFDSWDEDDKFSAWYHYFQLCSQLHAMTELMPPALKDKIWDNLYAHYEP